MSGACPRTRIWLYKSARSWTQTSCRPVSTTSAIHRGLRATKEAEVGNGRRTTVRKRTTERAWQSIDSEDTGMIRRDERYGDRERRVRQTTPSQYSGEDMGGGSATSMEERGGRTRNVEFESGSNGGPNIVMYAARKGHELSAREAAAYFHQNNDKLALRPRRPDAGLRMLPERIKRRSESGAQNLYPPVEDERPSGIMHAADPHAHEVDAMISSIKQHLSAIRDREISTDTRRVPSLMTGAAELRQALRAVNYMWTNATWTGKSIDRSLRTVLPPDLWSWREPDGSSTQLWFNRPERALQLIWKGGIADSEDGSRNKKQEREVSTANLSSERDVDLRFSMASGGRTTTTDNALTEGKDFPLHVELLRDYMIAIQKAEIHTDLRTTSSPSTDVVALRDLLRVANRKWKKGQWRDREVRRTLDALPSSIWSWKKEKRAKSALWVNRKGHEIRLVWKGGILDTEIADIESGDTGASENPVQKKFDGAAMQRHARELRTSERGQRAPKESASKNSTTSSTFIKAESEESEDQIPISIPYTTAASVFLYGFNTILAALKVKRRKLYQLYLNDRLAHREGSNPKTSIEGLANAAGVPIHANANVKLLDKMSEGRPHNGVVLEASKLPTAPVLGLGRPDIRSNIIPLTLERQNAEDIAVNGAPEAIPSATNTWRQPFIVMLDGITDPGNVGSVLRTCHFFGVDAVAVATNTCANLNSATLAKASSGACEAVRILALPKPSGFVYESAKAGWRIYAAVAPESPSQGAVSRSANTAAKYLTTSSLASSAPLTKHPCILMLGAEGEGLRENLKRKADYFVSIESAPRHSDFLDVGVDSVNVSVAASVLLESFLRKPEGVKNQAVESDLGF